MTVDIKALLERGVVDVIVRKDLEQKLKSGKKLRVKLGIDPTGSDLHLGHAVVLRKLKQFQDAGHIIILLIGDYTARIGDPTGKSETRVMLSEKEIKANMKHYIEQVAKIIDIDKAEIRYNSEWFEKMTMQGILELTSHKTVMQIMQREDFKKRYREEQDIALTEILYPIMQGYDSVMLESDIEIGGTDQLFNMLVGRDLQKKMNCKVVQNVVTVPILEGLDGVEKMSKSLNNYIGITETAKDIFGKTMSIPDNMILRYFELATEVPIDKIKGFEEAIKTGENPMNFKKQLGRELVSMYHNAEAAEIAEKEFAEIFKKKGIPMKIPLRKLKGIQWNIVDLLAETGIVTSKSEARRLVEGNAIKILPKITVPKGMKIVVKEAPKPRVLNKIDEKLDISQEQMLKIGKRHFIRVIGK